MKYSIFIRFQYHLTMNRIFLLFVLILMLLSGCREKVPVNAPYKPIWVVFGMLKSQDTIHYIRISKAFQTEEDAVVFARENDLSVKGLRVSITDGQNIFPAVQVDGVQKEPEDGPFFPNMTYYEIHTPPLACKYYRLEITDPADTSLRITAHTTVPFPPVIYKPRLLYDPFTGYCLDSIRLSQTDSVRFLSEPSVYYDIKFYLYYQNHQTPRYARWGTSYPFQTNSNVYRFEKDIILKSFRKILQDSAADYSVVSQPECGAYARYFSLELSQLDTFLYQYYYINNPKYVNFNDYRPVYSNLTGTEDVVGVFGSVGVRRIPLKISEEERIQLGF